jgi:hypothetical protein
MELTIQALIDEMPAAESRACPTCSQEAREVIVRRQYKVNHVIPLWRDVATGYRCTACGNHFLQQGGLGLWADVAVMAMLSVLLSPTVLGSGYWFALVLFQKGMQASDLEVPAGLFLGSCGLMFLPGRSLVRRIRTARSRGLTLMNETFSAAQ